jgi:DNA-binding CsgD family transcriptional regulator
MQISCYNIATSGGLKVIRINTMVLATNFHQLHNHIALSGCPDVESIMMPLIRPHGMTVFNYYRSYFDGSQVRLSTDLAWTQHYFKKGYINRLTVPQSCLNKPLNYFIWLTNDCPEMLLDAAINFNTSNGISIAIKHENYIEYFCFATIRDNQAIINFYINNLDRLQNYCHIFNEKAAHLLIEAERDRIITTNSISQPTPPNDHLNSTKITQREKDCISYLLKGLSNKEMARKLNISNRTVDTHVNNLKDKFLCRNKLELTLMLSKLFH